MYECEWSVCVRVGLLRVWGVVSVYRGVSVLLGVWGVGCVRCVRWCECWGEGVRCVCGDWEGVVKCVAPGVCVGMSGVCVRGVRASVRGACGVVCGVWCVYFWGGGVWSVERV